MISPSQAGEPSFMAYRKKKCKNNNAGSSNNPFLCNMHLLPTFVVLLLGQIDLFFLLSYYIEHSKDKLKTVSEKYFKQRNTVTMNTEILRSNNVCEKDLSSLPTFQETEKLCGSGTTH